MRFVLLPPPPKKIWIGENRKVLLTYGQLLKLVAIKPYYTIEKAFVVSSCERCTIIMNILWQNK